VEVGDLDPDGGGVGGHLVFQPEIAHIH
jgi:hypothetical protein